MKSAQSELLSLLGKLPGSYIVIEYRNGTPVPVDFTDELPAVFGYTADEYRALVNKGLHILPEDQTNMQRKLQECLADDNFRQNDFLFRMTHKTKGFIWAHMTLRKYSENLYIAALLDVSKELDISFATMEASDRLICVIEKNTKRFLFANSPFYELIDSTPADIMGKYCYELLCKSPDMCTRNDCMCYSSINAEPPLEFYNEAKGRHLTLTGREIVWGEYDAYVFYMTDITQQMQQEALLEDSEKRFEVALKNSDLMVWEYDIVNSRCINSAKAGRDYNIPIIIENYPESLFETGHTPPETVEQIKDVKRRLLNGETGFSVERRTVDKFGNSQWMKVDYALECDPSGKPLRAIVCGLDITAQKQLQQKYEEQMEYRNKLSQNAMFSIRLDLEDNSVLDHTCNEPALEEMVESAKTASELLQTFFRTAVFKDNADISRKQLTAAALRDSYALGRSQYQTVYRCMLLNCYLDLNLTVYRNPGNGHLEVFYVITDATTGVLTQDALAQVANKDYDFVAIITPASGMVQFLAHSAAAVMPQPNGEILSHYDTLVMDFANSMRDVYHSEEDYRAVSEEMLLDNIVQKLKAAPVYAFNCKVKGKNGDIQTFRLSFTYSDASHSQIVFTRSNISKALQEEQRSQQALEDALRAAKAADKAKTDFLARMSHDMRTPMNGIIGMTRLTQDIPDLPAEAQDNLAAVYDSSAYLLQLINDTLDMNKIASQKFSLNPEAVKAESLIQHILSTIRPLANQKQIQLDLVPINAQLDYIYVDRVRLQQIFLNILSNAVKFSSKGSTIRWEVECLRRVNGVAYTRISVEDHGCGMSEEYLKHIYEPFSQEATRISSGQEGTGLGMSIVKSLVELMGGQIEIASKQGVGTKVTVYLSFRHVYNTDPQIEASDVLLNSSLAGRRILLAEDHPLNATIFQRLLEKRGLLVERVENGKEAVRAFSASAPNYYDLVLMDIRMPEMDGLQASSAIRALERKDAQSTPIIALTANAYAEDVQAALAAGMNAHLAKPVEPEQLYATLAKYLCGNE